MKRSELKQIIKEEIQKVLNEAPKTAYKITLSYLKGDPESKSDDSIKSQVIYVLTPSKEKAIEAVEDFTDMDTGVKLKSKFEQVPVTSDLVEKFKMFSRDSDIKRGEPFYNAVFVEEPSRTY